MATPLLMYRSESKLSTKKEYDIKIQAAKTVLLRRVEGCTTTEKIRNENKHNELKTYAQNDRISEYKDLWRQHLNRISNKRFSKKIRQPIRKNRSR